MEREVERIYVSATRAYERGRMRRALLLAAPLAALALSATWIGTEFRLSCAVSVGLLASAWFFLWRGKSLGRAVLPGVFAGLVPLCLALCARSYGHVCTASGCVSLCVPACTVGGIVAGAFVARASLRAGGKRWAFLAAAFPLAAMVGALGCSCVGYGGILGLTAGLAMSLVPVCIPALKSRT